jgi:GTPase SAR1 family protein
VFDLTDRKTFDALKRWHNEVMNCSGNDIQIIVVGNKNDLDDRFF